VVALRARQRRNLVTTLLLSQGVPMLLGGDEIGRSQGGNNNAYCQDNETSWFDWDHVDEEFAEWVRKVAGLRRAHAVLRRRRWFQGRKIRDTEDLGWFRPDGATMTDDDWETGYARSIGVFLNGDAIPTPDAFGGRILDDSLFVILNASDTDMRWTVPGGVWARDWTVELDTSLIQVESTPVKGGDVVDLVARSILVLRAPAAEAT
jgi:isoamylase